jgi:hypothetical protein
MASSSLKEVLAQRFQDLLCDELLSDPLSREPLVFGFMHLYCFIHLLYVWHYEDFCAAATGEDWHLASLCFNNCFFLSQFRSLSVSKLIQLVN